jgi:SAM-dependent methyltransferase
MDAGKRLSALLTRERISDERRQRLRQRMHRLSRPAWLGTIRRTTPLSEAWGRDRGTPVDRYYIEQFLEQNRHLIRGRVLEIMNSGYTRRFGQRVEKSDVLDIDAQNPSATFVADLAAADAVPTEAFDCFILTQTLQYIFDLPAALAHAHRILRPGGTLLCTVPSVSRIGRKYVDSEYWRFTAASCSQLLRHAFPAGAVDVRARGNVLVSVAFLMGMACEELSRRELEVDDPYFPLVITARATRAPARVS